VKKGSYIYIRLHEHNIGRVVNFFRLTIFLPTTHLLLREPVCKAWRCCTYALLSRRCGESCENFLARPNLLFPAAPWWAPPWHAWRVNALLNHYKFMTTSALKTRVTEVLFSYGTRGMVGLLLKLVRRVLHHSELSSRLDEHATSLQ